MNAFLHWLLEGNAADVPAELFDFHTEQLVDHP